MELRGWWRWVLVTMAAASAASCSNVDVRREPGGPGTEPGSPGEDPDEPDDPEDPDAVDHCGTAKASVADVLVPCGSIAPLPKREMKVLAIDGDNVIALRQPTIVYEGYGIHRWSIAEGKWHVINEAFAEEPFAVRDVEARDGSVIVLHGGMLYRLPTVGWRLPVEVILDDIGPDKSNQIFLTSEGIYWLQLIGDAFFSEKITRLSYDGEVSALLAGLRDSSRPWLTDERMFLVAGSVPGVDQHDVWISTALDGTDVRVLGQLSPDPARPIGAADRAAYALIDDEGSNGGKGVLRVPCEGGAVEELYRLHADYRGFLGHSFLARDFDGTTLYQFPLEPDAQPTVILEAESVDNVAISSDYVAVDADGKIELFCRTTGEGS